MTWQGSTTAQKNGNEDCSGTGGMVTWQVGVSEYSQYK